MTSQYGKFFPIVRKEAPPRFLCDEMLNRLGRWLRAAGHDTALADAGADDATILRQAMSEQRWLLTRDRGFLQRRGAADWVVMLSDQSLDEQARLLRRCLQVDWLYAPFTRCMLCNSPLQTPAAETGHDSATRYCLQCDKLYWEGGHVRRMRAVLARWQQAL